MSIGIWILLGIILFSCLVIVALTVLYRTPFGISKAFPKLNPNVNAAGNVIVQDLLKDWGVNFKRNHLDNFIRTNRVATLHGLMASKDMEMRSSFLRKDSEMDEDFKMNEWIPITSNNSGESYIYNPTFVKKDENTGVILTRDDRDKNWSCSLWRYISIPYHIHSDGKIYIHDQEAKCIQFIDEKSGEEIQLASSRQFTTKDLIVIEDLRSTHLPNGNNLLSGVALTNYTEHCKTEFITGTYDFETETVKIYNRIKSPFGRGIEKNWLFVPTENPLQFDVIYEYGKDCIEIFEWEKGNSELTFKANPSSFHPPEWTYRKTVSHLKAGFHMTSVTELDDKHLLLILHRKERKLLYTYFGAILKKGTYDVVGYMPEQLFTDIGIKIFFIMNIAFMKNNQMTAFMGVSDSVAGIATYDTDKFTDKIKWKKHYQQPNPLHIKYNL